MRPLVKRAPDGRPYTVPSAPRYPASEPTPQLVDDTASGPEPTPAPVDRSVKVTADDVRAIRSDYAAGKWSQHDLAYIYGTTRNTISRIVRGQVHTEPTPRERDS
jgi:hypothetical protein